MVNNGVRQALLELFTEIMHDFPAEYKKEQGTNEFESTEQLPILTSYTAIYDIEGKQRENISCSYKDYVDGFNQLKKIQDGVNPQWNDREKFAYILSSLAEFCIYDPTQLPTAATPDMLPEIKPRKVNLYEAMATGRTMCETISYAIKALCDVNGIHCQVLPRYIYNKKEFDKNSEGFVFNKVVREDRKPEEGEYKNLIYHYEIKAHLPYTNKNGEEALAPLIYDLSEELPFYKIGMPPYSSPYGEISPTLKEQLLDSFKKIGYNFDSGSVTDLFMNTASLEERLDNIKKAVGNKRIGLQELNMICKLANQRNISGKKIGLEFNEKLHFNLMTYYVNNVRHLLISDNSKVAVDVVENNNSFTIVSLRTGDSLKQVKDKIISGEFILPGKAKIEIIGKFPEIFDRKDKDMRRIIAKYERT